MAVSPAVLVAEGEEPVGSLGTGAPDLLKPLLLLILDLGRDLSFVPDQLAGLGVEGSRYADRGSLVQVVLLILIVFVPGVLVKRLPLGFGQVDAGVFLVAAASV